MKITSIFILAKDGRIGKQLFSCLRIHWPQLLTFQEGVVVTPTVAPPLVSLSTPELNQLLSVCYPRFCQRIKTCALVAKTSSIELERCLLR